MTNPEFINILSHVWENDPPLVEAVVIFEKEASAWACNNIGNIFRKKDKLLRKIYGIQKSPNYHRSMFLQKLEKELINDYNVLLRMEEDYWKLKSRITWLNKGDASTKFVHTSTLVRRRRNRIVSLKLDNSLISMTKMTY